MFKAEKTIEPVPEPVISCPLCRLEIKKTDMDITEHLFNAHGTYSETWFNELGY
jgi:hypothetical protein